MRIHCSKCKTQSLLKPKELTPGLIAYHCTPCGSDYLPARNYQKWSRKTPESTSLDHSTPSPKIQDDTFDALLCPECQRIMLKYRVDHNIDFKIDFCRSCNGVWLDKNEWDSLERKNLHKTLNYVFTDSWQSRIRRLQTDQQLETIFREKLGREDYRITTEFKAWLSKNPCKQEILAYLRDGPDHS